MKEFNISRTLKDSVTNVLTRRGIPFEVIEKDERLKIRVDISGERFHKIVLRAKMEKIQEERNSSIPYVARAEFGDPMVIQEIGMAYFVYDDEDV